VSEEGVSEEVNECRTGLRVSLIVRPRGTRGHRRHRAVDGWAKSCGRGRYIPYLIHYMYTIQ
jgi:hypothetical protein